MKAVPLAELVQPTGKRAGTETDLPVYSVTKHSGFIPSLEYFKKQVFSRDVTDYKLVEPGDFAYATIHLDEGSIGIAHERALISPMYTVFKPDSSLVNPEYLIRYLKSPRALAHYPQLGKGAIHRRKAISLAALGGLPVPLPPLPEQRRIAAILAHADALRTKRRQVLTHLDALTQSIFNDMFGDLRTSAWDRIPFGEVVVKVDNGTSPNCETRPAEADEWGVLKLGAVTYGHFQADENKAYLGELGNMASNEVQPGDVLMTRKNTRELVGAVALVDDVRRHLLLPDLIFRLHLDTDRVDRRYFHALMMSPQKRPAVRDLSSGSASSMPNISKARLAKLPLELPPLALQQQFASKVASLDSFRLKTLDASRVDTELFASLQSRAFRGEL